MGLIWILSLTSVAAWSSLLHSKGPISSTELDATTRRAFFFTSALTTAVTLLPRATFANEEPSTDNPNMDSFDAVSEGLRQQGWPNSASPLPIPSNSSLGTNKNETATKKFSSDFEAALQEASKKKQVDPRTHG